MKPPTQVRDSYNHAQKMRAAMTYGFGRLCGLGSLPWHESESTGKMVGNPSVSETVATYMTSLRRRKVCVPSLDCPSPDFRIGSRRRNSY